MTPYVETPVTQIENGDVAFESELDASDSSQRQEQDPLERQRELNDNLALIRILDDPSSFGEFPPFASEPALGNTKLRRQTLLNFVAFCLAHDNNTVALATTIHSEPPNRIILHVARSTGHTAIYERARAEDFLRELKRAWKQQTYGQMQIVWGHVVQMTAPKLRKRLKKLHAALQELQPACADVFSTAVDAWGKEEASPDVHRWMTTWHRESQTAALKDVFRQFAASVEADDFDAPDLFTVAGCFRLYHSYFFPISVLTGSLFLREVEYTPTCLPADIVRRLRRLRRRCMKLRWYEIGVHLLCTYARETVRRILGPENFAKFLCADNDAFQIDWLETPGAVSSPIRRAYNTAQEALVGILASLSDESDGDNEPFACTIEHRPSAVTSWTSLCTPVYHPELQIIDHLRQRTMRPSPAFVGCSKLACRACKFYVDQLSGGRWSLYTGGLEMMDLKVPAEWLVPPTDAGILCAEILREEAGRLVLREDNVQRIAWEMRHATEAMECDGGQAIELNLSPGVLT